MLKKRHALTEGHHFRCRDRVQQTTLYSRLEQPACNTLGPGPSRSGPLQMQSTTISLVISEVSTFTCQEPGCKSRPFKRKADLNRHSRTHDSLKRYNCPAVDCERTGSHGFFRRDKLVDHILAGHKEDDWFSCACCGERFIRAEYEVHANSCFDSSAHMDRGAGDYRTCPMPRCSFKVYVPREWVRPAGRMTLLQEHLLEKHTPQTRAHFSDLLARRGYDARTCELICPICSPPSHFKNSGDFENHFMHTHFHGPVCSRHEDGSCEATCLPQNYWRLLVCISVLDEARQHRLAILRIWPLFINYPVWADIRCRGRRDHFSLCPHLGSSIV